MQLNEWHVRNCADGSVEDLLNTGFLKNRRKLFIVKKHLQIYKIKESLCNS